MRGLQGVLFGAAVLAAACGAQTSDPRPLRSTQHDNPDVDASQCELISHRGLACERHNVTTKDGYILAVFRIPRPGARVAVLQHGLLSSSFSFTNNLRNESLAYILHDAGFDVWLPNSRGNTFSMSHVALDPSMPAFWQFSWDEMAAYDVPAVVDFVRNATGSATVAYVGHSQGTTMAFGALATQPRMRAAIRPYVALAPVAYVHQSPSKLLHTLANLDVDRWLELLGVKDFLPSTASLKRLGLHCEATPAACADALSWIMGKSGQLNVSRIAVYLTEEPAGTSVQNMGHWAQSFRAPAFQHYDYGCKSASECENFVRYGQRTPPPYHLASIRGVPTYMLHGGRDPLSDPADVKTLLSEFPAASLLNVTFVPEYNHQDFVLAMNAATRIYPQVVSTIEEFARAPTGWPADSGPQLA